MEGEFILWATAAVTRIISSLGWDETKTKARDFPQSFLLSYKVDAVLNGKDIQFSEQTLLQ